MRDIKLVILLFMSFIFVLTCTQAQSGNVFNVKNYGAIGDGKTDDAIAIQKAIDACNKNGGGRVLLPAGNTFLASPFDLKSFVEFYLEYGSK